MVRSARRRWVYIAILGVLAIPFIVHRFAGPLGLSGRGGVLGGAVYTDQEASGHLGEYATVTGKVVEVRSPVSASFLDFGRPFPREDFTAVIFARDRSSFGDLQLLTGRMVRVTGRIDAYHGGTELILRSPGQLHVVR